MKFSFDIYTGDGVGRFFRMHLFSDEGRLASHMYNTLTKRVAGETSHRGSFTYNSSGVSILPNKQPLVFPKNTWITLELYIDYNNSNIYFSIPYYGYTIMHKTQSLYLGGLDNDGNPNPDDSPVKLMVWENHTSNTQTFITKLDNIGISAQNTIPTLGVNEFLSDQFNLYPNPDDSPVKLMVWKNKISDTQTYIIKLDNISISAQNTIPTVSINEVLSEQFNLYPNPAINVVNITNSDNMFVNQVQVYDLSGKLINTQNFNNEAEIHLNVENLASGTYLLHLQTDQGITVKKLIKK